MSISEMLRETAANMERDGTSVYRTHPYSNQSWASGGFRLAKIANHIEDNEWVSQLSIDEQILFVLFVACMLESEE
jgi:3-deoxy-D-arabino-heptulosonate 7-phosphate (DAHP) synthase